MATGVAYFTVWIAAGVAVFTTTICIAIGVALDISIRLGTRCNMVYYNLLVTEVVWVIINLVATG